MLLNLLKGKIHCAAVTEANLHYMGSITIDEALMEAAGILPNERVQVVDNNNGERLETYTIPGPRGSGAICLNGAAARCVQPGDTVIIMAYALFTEDEAARHRPAVVMVDEKNRVREVRRAEHHRQIDEK
ncbi:MAG: aspartate 1-decarboxylase [Schwartzia sp. (in: firmicutes)]